MVQQIGPQQTVHKTLFLDATFVFIIKMHYVLQCITLATLFSYGYWLPSGERDTEALYPNTVALKL